MENHGEAVGTVASRADELSEDQLFKLLSSGRRRAALRCLVSEGGEAPLAEITSRVALEEGIGEDAAPGEYKKVYVSLYQTHIPALAEAGAVEYDRESRIVQLQSRAAPLLAHLDVDRRSATRQLLSRLFRHD